MMMIRMMERVMEWVMFMPHSESCSVGMFKPKIMMRRRRMDGWM